MSSQAWAGVWKVLGDWVNLVLSQTWKEFSPETRRMEADADMEWLRGHSCQDNFVQWKLTLVMPCLLWPRSPTPSTNTTMPRWHDWYERNCGFCLNPGHMQTIKNSSFQNLPQVNALLIQVSSSHMRAPLPLPKEVFS